MDKDYLTRQKIKIGVLDMPQLIITGKSPNVLLCDIKEIELQFGGLDFPVIVLGKNLDNDKPGKSQEISLRQIKRIVQGVKGADLQKYIQDNLCKTNETTKTGGSDDIYIVYSPNVENYRNPRFTKPKKKKVKTKKTHRKPKKSKK